MNIGAILPWFGAKRTMAKRIVEVIGDHNVYWEPFCGSLSVLLSKARGSAVIADAHGDRWLAPVGFLEGQN